MPRARMLLVEDDAALAELVGWHFTREDFEVAQTADGEEALLMAREQTPDIVLRWSASRGWRSAAACAARPRPPTCRSSC